jgi:Fe-S cluster biogenesis protein NfuA
MPEAHDVRTAGERVDALLTDLGHLGDATVVAMAEELVHTLVGLYGAGLDRVMEIVTETEAAETLHRLAADDLVSALLIVHDLHPLTTLDRVRTALDGVRPYLGLHDGGVELLGIAEDGVVRLRLTGTCDGCPSSQATITDAIQRAIAEAAPEVGGVEVEQDTGPTGPLLQIGSRPPGPCPVPEPLAGKGKRC